MDDNNNNRDRCSSGGGLELSSLHQAEVDFSFWASGHGVGWDRTAWVKINSHGSGSNRSHYSRRSVIVYHQWVQDLLCVRTAHVRDCLLLCWWRKDDIYNFCLYDWRCNINVLRCAWDADCHVFKLQDHHHGQKFIRCRIQHRLSSWLCDGICPCCSINVHFVSLNFGIQINHGIKRKLHKQGLFWTTVWNYCRLRPWRVNCGIVCTSGRGHIYKSCRFRFRFGRQDIIRATWRQSSQPSNNRRQCGW